jgi:hypothetical protein
MSTSMATGTAATTSLAHPTGGGGTRLAVPRLLQFMILLLRSTKAIPLSSMLRPECCGDICCAMNEVCTRSFSGPKCWPKAGKHAASDGKVSAAVEETSPQATQVLKGEQQDEEEVAVHIATAAVIRGVVEESGAVRPATPKFLYVFVMLITFVTAMLSPRPSGAANDTPIPGIPQSDPSTSATISTSWLFGERWSCHEPNKKCGSKGCFNPDEHVCCSQPDRKYGLCSKSKGEECCGRMCCSEDTECRKNGKDEVYLCYPKGSSSD